MIAVRNSVVLGLLIAGSMAAQQEREVPSGLKVETVRLYRSEGTLVKAFAEVPHRLLARGSDGRLHYRVGVTVRDSSGATLMQESWQQSAIPVDAVASAAGLEMLEFLIAPGVYQLAVTVVDSVSGQEYRDSSSIAGFAAAPLTSDLMVSRNVRTAKPEDSLPRPGEWRHGNLVIGVTPSLRLSVIKPELFYVVEVYANSKDSAALAYQVLEAAGKVVVQGRPRAVAVDVGGSVLTGGLNLSGVPQGDYRLRVTVGLGGREQTLEAPFEVRKLESPPPVVAAAGNPDEEYFSAMTEEELERARAPLIHIARSGELNSYDEHLSVEAKARFLAQFWRKRDPNPNDGVNPERESFYARMNEADRLFREGGRSRVQGWRTERGRIYLKYGVPDETWRRPEEGQTPAVEVWRYTQGRNRYFIFADRSRIGGYLLLHSNELTEPGRPDWGDQLGYYGVEAVERYLGVNLGLRGLTRP